MRVPTVGWAAAARRGGWVLACAGVLAGCVPVAADDETPGSTYSPPAQARVSAEDSREELDYTIDLPAGWHDLTDEYLAALPTSVLNGFWSTADDVSDTSGPYVTMSMRYLDPTVDSTSLSEHAAQTWAEDLGDPVRGDSGYAETADGGVISWASVTGDLDGEMRTEHVAHVLYGPYYMYVEIDTVAGDEASAHAILDALETVTISGPVDVGERGGAPVVRSGAWNSYCGTLSSAAQSGWSYVYQGRYDGSLWTCPEAFDYLGAWVVPEGDSSYAVSVMRDLDEALDDRLAELGTPTEVGGVATSKDGYVTELLGKETFVAPNGTAGVRVDTSTTAPGDTVGYVARLYAFADDRGGVVEVYVYDREMNVVPSTDWLEPFIATLATPVAN